MDDVHSEPGRPAPGVSSSPGTRPRFSLLTALLLTALVAAGIVIWQLYAELVPLRAENRRLRDEVGELSIEDETKFHAVAVRTDDDLTWKWRIWIPQGGKYQLHYSSEQIPETGFAPSHGWISVGEAGEHWVEYRIRQDAESGQWMDQLLTQGGSVGSSQQDWVGWGGHTSTGKGVYNSTQSFDVGKPVVLKRFRVSQASSTSAMSKQTAGFMVWLEPVP
jgi:hypothetical protein